MKITQDIGIRICGTGSSVPERKISNDDMATIVETNDEWIRTRTGISNRHFADKETNLSLGMEAAEKAMEMAFPGYPFAPAAGGAFYDEMGTAM